MDLFLLLKETLEVVILSIDIFSFPQKLAPEKLEKFSKLVAFMKRFEELPKIADYVKTDK